MNKHDTNASAVAETIQYVTVVIGGQLFGLPISQVDRKSTRLNSSHVKISYAVFCLKKKITNFLSHLCVSLQLTPSQDKRTKRRLDRPGTSRSRHSPPPRDDESLPWARDNQALLQFF